MTSKPCAVTATSFLRRWMISGCCMHSRLLVLLLIVLVSTNFRVHGLDAKFTPSGNDEQLPLSKKYRDHLRKLCTLLHSNKPLPQDYANKKEMLQRMCSKLAADDKNVQLGTSGPLGFPAHTVVITLAGLGGLYAAWTHRQAIQSLFRKWFSKRNPSRRLNSVGSGSGSRSRAISTDRGAAGASAESADSSDFRAMVREARLRKLGGISNTDVGEDSNKQQ